MSNKRLSTQIVEKAREAHKNLNELAAISDPNNAAEQRNLIADALMDIIILGTKMDARTGSIDPSRKRRAGGASRKAPGTE